MNGGGLVGNKTFVFLLAVLLINTLRYTTYLLEGTIGIYYLVMLSINILALIFTLSFRKKFKNHT